MELKRCARANVSITPSYIPCVQVCLSATHTLTHAYKCVCQQRTHWRMRTSVSVSNTHTDACVHVCLSATHTLTHACAYTLQAPEATADPLGGPLDVAPVLSDDAISTGEALCQQCVL